jgi:hypothetical protein
VAVARYHGVLKKRKAKQAKKDKEGSDADSDDDDASDDKVEIKSVLDAVPPPVVPVKTPLDGEQLGRMLKDALDESIGKIQTTLELGLRNASNAMSEVKKRMDKMEEDGAELKGFISEQFKRAALPSEITLSPLPTKAEAAVTASQKVDEAVEKITEEMKDDLESYDDN